LGKEEPQAILDLLKKDRKGLFEWSPIAESNQTQYVEITRRKGALGSLRNVSEAFSWDHDRLDTLEIAASSSLEAGNFPEARRLYEVFRRGLNRHIRIEEEVLFPIFELRAGLPSGGPTSVMRAEHRQIRMYLEEISANLDLGFGVVREPREALREMLSDHNRKEELVLYRNMDELLTAAEGDALVELVQDYPA
jgi:hemerythrin-like domain-containing protein